MITPKGFAVDTQRGMVEAGMTRQVNITWTPPKGHDVSPPEVGCTVRSPSGEPADRQCLLETASGDRNAIGDPDCRVKVWAQV